MFASAGGRLPDQRMHPGATTFTCEYCLIASTVPQCHSTSTNNSADEVCGWASNRPVASPQTRSAFPVFKTQASAGYNINSLSDQSNGECTLQQILTVNYFYIVSAVFGIRTRLAVASTVLPLTWTVHRRQRAAIKSGRMGQSRVWFVR